MKKTPREGPSRTATPAPSGVSLDDAASLRRSRVGRNIKRIEKAMLGDTTVKDDGGMRDRILDAAISVLESSGVKKLAQPHIAKVAGIAQGHLTYYFPKKSDLLGALMARAVELFRDDIPQGLLEELHGRADEVRAKVLRFAGTVVKNRSRMRMILGLIVAAEEDPQLRERMAENVLLVRRVLGKLLGKSVKDPDVDLTMALLWGIGIQHLVLEGKQDELATDRLLERLEAWVATMPPPAKRGRTEEP
jgi:AcrR family transcriptional regulator